MTYQLIPIEKGRSPAIALQRPVLLIGRHPECDVRIDLPKISRRHCCLALAYDRVLIRDLGSHNGLRVNGRLVEEARLHAGDEVAIGPFIYRLESSCEACGPQLPAGSAGVRCPEAGGEISGGRAAAASPPYPSRPTRKWTWSLSMILIFRPSALTWDRANETRNARTLGRVHPPVPRRFMVAARLNVRHGAVYDYKGFAGGRRNGLASGLDSSDGTLSGVFPCSLISAHPQGSNSMQMHRRVVLLFVIFLALAASTGEARAQWGYG